MVNKKKGLLWKVMTVVLAANVCLIASQHYAQPQLLTDIQGMPISSLLPICCSTTLQCRIPWYSNGLIISEHTLDISYFIFLGVYSLEIMVKLCGYGFNKV